MIRHVFLDIDDTLFPSSEFSELARRNALSAMVEQGLDVGIDQLRKMLDEIIEEKGSNYQNQFDELCKRLGIKRPGRFVAAAVGAYHNTKSSISPFPEVPRALLKLKESGYKIYIASNGDSVKQWDKLIRMGIELYFDDVFVSEEIGEEKSRGFFHKVMKQLRIKPENCVMVGDREDADIVPAKKAGIKTVRIRRGKYSEGKTAADFEIKNLRKLEKILKRIK